MYDPLAVGTVVEPRVTLKANACDVENKGNYRAKRWPTMSSNENNVLTRPLRIERMNSSRMLESVSIRRQRFLICLSPESRESS